MRKSWGDICEEESKHESDDQEEDLLALAKFKAKAQPQSTATAPTGKRPIVTLTRLQAVKAHPAQKEVLAKVEQQGPLCYCGEPSKVDTVKKHGKHEPVGTEFVSCSSGACKYWFKTPVPENLPTGECLCGTPAAVCVVKKPESPHCGKMMLTCAFYKCKFYSIVE